VDRTVHSRKPGVFRELPIEFGDELHHVSGPKPHRPVATGRSSEHCTNGVHHVDLRKRSEGARPNVCKHVVVEAMPRATKHAFDDEGQ